MMEMRGNMAEQQSQSKSQANSQSNTQFNSKPLQVLIIEDETEINDIVKELVLSLGYEAHQCYNGREALDFLQDCGEPPVLVICDLSMPQMSGLEFIKNQMAKNLNLNVCVLTSNVTCDSLLQSLQLGVTDFIIKPANLDEFRDKIARLAEFGRRRQNIQRLESQVPEVARARHQDNMFRIINCTKKAG